MTKGNEMTDRELLENAAKAAGLEFAKWDDELGAIYWPHRSPLTSCHLWNPLTDDGDALRLAVKLGICFGPNLDGDMAVAFGSDGRNITEEHGGDSYAATRRAIVRAAAEIGKAIE